MMAAERGSATLLERLPQVLGTYEEGADLSKLTWFRVGGPAEVLYRPAHPDDLATFLGNLPGDIPLTVVGIGSNLLIRDGGVPGVVIRLGDGFSEISISGDQVTAGAAASGLKLANRARDEGLTGLEFLSGIPGSIGGALAGNAGAFGSEISDVFNSAQALGRKGKLRRLDKPAMDFSYRHSGAPADLIFTDAILNARPGERVQIAHRMAEIQAERTATQPRHAPTGGSTFVNPPGAKAWELIDQAGCRELTRGGARVSEKHTNFMINTGNATAADLEGLGEEIRRRVMEKSGIKLDWEIKRIGQNTTPGPREVEK